MYISILRRVIISNPLFDRHFMAVYFACKCFCINLFKFFSKKLLTFYLQAVFVFILLYHILHICVYFFSIAPDRIFRVFARMFQAEIKSQLAEKKYEIVIYIRGNFYISGFISNRRGGCGHILGLFYAANPRLCLYSTGLI